MPRLIACVNDGEPRLLGDIRVTARHLRGKGRRIRVVIDLPPGGADRIDQIAAEFRTNIRDKNCASRTSVVQHSESM